MIKGIRSKLDVQRKRHQLIKQLQALEMRDEVLDELAILKYQEEAFNRELLSTVLTGTTAIFYVSLGGSLMVVNGVGLLALLTIHHTVPQRDSYQKWTREGLVGFMGVSMVSTVATAGISLMLSPLGLATSALQLGTLSVLWQSRQAQADSPEMILESEQQLLQLRPV